MVELWLRVNCGAAGVRAFCRLHLAPGVSQSNTDGWDMPARGGPHCSHVQEEEEEEEEEDMKMMIEPAVRGPGSEHEKLFVRWSGRRSVMARIG